MVLSDIEKFTIRPLFGEKVVLGGNGRIPSAEQIEEARQLILRNAAQYSRSHRCDALTVTYWDARLHGETIFFFIAVEAIRGLPEP
jgi:hypothetical protein